VSSGRLYLVGCNTGDGIDLEGSDVLARHARLCTHDTGVVIEPVGKVPVSLNGRPITVPTCLRDGDWLALGETLFQGHLPDSEFTRPPARPPPPGLGKAQAPGDIVTIGRDPHCDHTIDSPLVSREHARLISEGGGSMSRT
jgi:pSer/pThr/pTyr-binding forkhead associated (FHA) protein